MSLKITKATHAAIRIVLPVLSRGSLIILGFLLGFLLSGRWIF